MGFGYFVESSIDFVDISKSVVSRLKNNFKIGNVSVSGIS